MEKNFNKYYSYKNAIDQINAAIEAGFFLEAITIEESILTDRLLRVCRDHGYIKKVEKSTLGSEIDFIKSHSETINNNELMGFLNDVNIFRENRNTCLHQIAKSDPGAPTIEYEALILLAKKTAQDGKILTKRVSNWAAKYKKASGSIDA